MDQRVGDVRASLKKHGFEDNTLFIYTSDQGSEWPHSKWTLYDAGIHVPFLAVWPGVTKPGALCDALISFIDVTPTFIDLAGGEPPQGVDGKSFRSVLTGQEKSFRDTIYASHTRDGDMNIFPQRCVRDTRYKYILNLTPETTWTTHWTKVPGIPREPQGGLGHLGRKGENRPARRENRPSSTSTTRRKNCTTHRPTHTS